jgi:hypothetical protein
MLRSDNNKRVIAGANDTSSFHKSLHSETAMTLSKDAPRRKSDTI